MNFKHLFEHENDLLLSMEKAGYCSSYLVFVRSVIHKIRQYESASWKSYDDVCDTLLTHYSPSSYPRCRSAINIIGNYDLYGSLIKRDNHPLLSVSRQRSLEHLNDLFKKDLITYAEHCRKKNNCESTIINKTFKLSSCLYRLQKQGCLRYEDIKEENMIAIFTKDSKPAFNAYRIVMTDFLWQSASTDEVTKRRLINMIPPIRQGRKNIQYLTDEEFAAIQGILDVQSSEMTLQDKAIGTLLLYTGLRASDIAGIKLSDIDWINDSISLIQQKTKQPLSIPLSGKVGNVIFDYIVKERPVTDCPSLFLAPGNKESEITAKYIRSNVVERILRKAGIRKEKGDRKGTHIFRHRFVSELLKVNESHAVISSLLGHLSPRSLDPYLNSDFAHLKECALSVESFPLSNEVFSL